MQYALIPAVAFAVTVWSCVAMAALEHAAATLRRK